jgi:hypothetical protein
VHLLLFGHVSFYPLAHTLESEKVLSNLDEMGRDEIEEHLVVHINPPSTYIYIYI